jgi:two-component system, NarL family, sensor kinase
VSGLVVMALIGAIAVAFGRQIGTQEAIRDAKEVSQLAGRGVVAPNVGRGVLAGDPGALRRLDAVVRRRVLTDGIVRVKLWAADGRIVYSDEPRLVGTRFALEEDERRAIAGRAADADVSDVARPENRFERPYGKLLEVYVPVRAATGRPLLFEAYQRFSSVSASGRRLWLAFAPALLGGLVVLQLVNLPLARSLARRLGEGQRQREALLQRALDASERERRTIAADLHDGIVQDLLALSYGLAARAERLGGGGGAPARDELRGAAAQTGEHVSALRSLLIDIYPPSLQRTGLAAALADLARTYTLRGMETTIDLAVAGEPATGTQALMFRCAQEALRNACRPRARQDRAGHAAGRGREPGHGRHRRRGRVRPRAAGGTAGARSLRPPPGARPRRGRRRGDAPELLAGRRDHHAGGAAAVRV